MANTLTNLIPTIYTAADTVARELTGFIPAVYRNSSAARAALNETILYPVTGAMTAGDVAAAATGPDPADQSVGNGTMSISKSRSVVFHWTGEEQIGLKNAGFYAQILQDQFSQAMRTLCNEVESDLGDLYKMSSRAYGTAGTTPFATANDYTDASEVLRILKDNGCPMMDCQLIINTAAGAKLRGKQAAALDAGSDSILRQGILLDIHGFSIRESAYVKAHTKGTGASYVTNGATAAGVTDIALITGSGTVLAGDVAAFAADTANKYIVGTGIAAPGTISLNKPGARMVIPTGNALTIGASYAANLAFHRSAIHLITRAPAMPEGGDAADDVIEVTDPRSGLAFQVAMYRQRRRVAFEVGLAWGVKAVKSEFMATLLG
jgi:hypothetical protein